MALGGTSLISVFTIKSLLNFEPQLPVVGCLQVTVSQPDKVLSEPAVRGTDQLLLFCHRGLSGRLHFVDVPVDLASNLDVS